MLKRLLEPFGLAHLTELDPKPEEQPAVEQLPLPLLGALADRKRQRDRGATVTVYLGNNELLSAEKAKLLVDQAGLRSVALQRLFHSSQLVSELTKQSRSFAILSLLFGADALSVNTDVAINTSSLSTATELFVEELATEIVGAQRIARFLVADPVVGWVARAERKERMKRSFRAPGRHLRVV